ncbi:KilA-N domain-containing protein [Pseudomonas citronellolis]|uniref:KilA-N domain-containing protein n=1 Tax=Pseudomonas citronellolis TaxID=53408 RepID=UPI001428BA20|nr:KilA-N domain-containing protein [Pseudomonas humi]
MPAEWLRYSTAKDLIDELKVGNPTLCPLASEMTDFPVNKNRGRFGGTFVVKELVYAYAMWISPKFQLEVIRSYDRLATEGVAVHASAAEAVLDDPLTYMEKVIAQAKVLKAERDRLALENKEMAPKAVVFDNCVALRQESLATFVRTFEGLTKVIKQLRSPQGAAQQPLRCSDTAPALGPSCTEGWSRNRR